MMKRHIILQENGLDLLDQRYLPNEITYFRCRDLTDFVRAISDMVVRGAPAIGVTAAYGFAFSLQNDEQQRFNLDQIEEIYSQLGKTRPTAVNLFWALDRMRNKAISLVNETLALSQKHEILLAEAQKIHREDESLCEQMAQNAFSLVNNNGKYLTHCNAGYLATGGLGTALGVFHYAKQQGKQFQVFAGETRPRWQGARLTIWELQQDEIDVTLFPDTAAASIMQKEKIDAIFVGADRIAKNGDTANKIGTLNLAIIARYLNIPFYVVAPSTTFDLSLETGKEIPIEYRNVEEVVCVDGQFISDAKQVRNPAFDVTPAHLITAIICEKGILETSQWKKYKNILF